MSNTSRVGGLKFRPGSGAARPVVAVAVAGHEGEEVLTQTAVLEDVSGRSDLPALIGIDVFDCLLDLLAAGSIVVIGDSSVSRSGWVPWHNTRVCQ